MKYKISAFAVAAVLFALGIWWITDHAFVPSTRRIAVAPPVSPEALNKVKTLEDILRSKNDNDPRLDHDFNDLSSEAKVLFEEKYRAIPAERRNARGTVVYLLGKNLKTPEDWEFFREVALEPPCLSLSDCTKKPAPGSDEEATGDEVTLAYPSLVALRQARRVIEESRSHPSAQSAQAKVNERAALDFFAAAKKSQTRAVARMAASLENKFALP